MTHFCHWSSGRAGKRQSTIKSTTQRHPLFHFHIFSLLNTDDKMRIDEIHWDTHTAMQSMRSATIRQKKMIWSSRTEWMSDTVAIAEINLQVVSISYMDDKLTSRSSVQVTYEVRFNIKGWFPQRKCITAKEMVTWSTPFYRRAFFLKINRRKNWKYSWGQSEEFKYGTNSFCLYSPHNS